MNLKNGQLKHNFCWVLWRGDKAEEKTSTGGMRITPTTLSSLEQTLCCFVLLLLLFMNVMSTAFSLWFPFIWNPGKPETQNKTPTLCLRSVGLETSLGLRFIFSFLPTGIRIRHWTQMKPQNWSPNSLGYGERARCCFQIHWRVQVFENILSLFSTLN